jgi:hypothetical protein
MNMTPEMVFTKLLDDHPIGRGTLAVNINLKSQVACTINILQ